MEDQGFIERWDYVVKISGMKYKEIAEYLDVSRNYIYELRQGKANPSSKVLQRLGQIETSEGRFNLHWLLLGEGERFLPQEKEDESAKLNSSLAFDLLSREIEHWIEECKKIEDLQENDAKLQDQMNQLDNKVGQGNIAIKNQVAYQGEQISKLQAHLQIEEEPEQQGEPEEAEVELPDYGLVAAAGPVLELDHHRQIHETFPVRESLLPKNRDNLFVGHIRGNSMSDIIPDGAKLLLRVAKEPISGRVYLFTIRGQSTIKKFRLDENGPHFEYMDGSGRIIYPEKGEQWYCNAKFLAVLRNAE